ncbi:methylmalonyl-CoA mutase subunit beta [Neobacillus sp. MM2021_6]|uniref:methylmalonyl-CoA mutase subunit beta n=1 Tax=Bacillaceae TaxID=186817 RepID=UPI00140BBB73|nr:MULTISPECIES: methylmalonyl-CoA mutase subunit beta [Bacillaceae]MBO0960824.1 methylmalonyl-CoA mutase subunit beta [Neobacillus sp. MM2021_6]NHC17052.1 methylmalonyl-CoA mutase [Bacillus sp. MM2020_4]
MGKIKSQAFAIKTMDEWKEKAESSLKGKTVKSLETTTYENIVLKPLYSKTDEQPISEFPGASDFRRGIYPLGYRTNEWIAAQRISYQTPEELQVKLHQSFEKGQSAISFDVKEALFEREESLVNVLGNFNVQYPFAINAKDLQLAFHKQVTNLDGQDQICGYIGADPVALFAEDGLISEEFLKDWLKNIQQSSILFPNLRTILIDTVPYHNGGANGVQELGISLAEGVYYLEKLQEKGMELEEILGKMVFQFAIGGNFFMEIAKLRAARVLWNRITQLYSVNEKSRGMMIAAETSSSTKTVHDPHVNLLRAGNEAFAAVIGGVQYLHVSPFDEHSGATPFSERIARNVQLLLKEEAHLKKVIDPAGGSWYVEELTNLLAEKAWSFFQQIEASGGILEVLKTNWLQHEITSVYERRNLDIQTRKQSIVGTNVYANLDETVPSRPLSREQSRFAGGVRIEAVTSKRLAEPFEELRSKAKYLEGKFGSVPTVGMICLGELKQYKSRLDFMKGFFASGGINTVEGRPILTVEDARQFVTQQPVKYFCLCGTNDQYESLGHEILMGLKAELPERTFYLAGLPEKENQARWMNEGIKQFIHLKSNCYEAISTLLADMEVNTIEKTKA